MALTPAGPNRGRQTPSLAKKALGVYHHPGGVPSGNGRLAAAARALYVGVMTLRKLALLGHPVLLEPAIPVRDLGDPAVQRLIDDMLATMIDAGGVGLAAPQVYEPLRVIVALELEDRADRQQSNALVLVNPELALEGEPDVLEFEGCLSLPGLRGRVPRHASLSYRALDRQGAEIAGRARGFLARILQHEVDHLDGILYPMRMPTLRDLSFTSELHHLNSWLEQRDVGA